jgi:hypothetical protein
VKRVILVHPEWGIYLGSCLGLGFWSQLDPCGQTEACTFPSEAEARAVVEAWWPMVGKYDPDDFRYVEVETGEDGYATMEECVSAGVDFRRWWLLPASITQNSSKPQNQIPVGYLQRKTKEERNKWLSNLRRTSILEGCRRMWT